MALRLAVLAPVQGIELGIGKRFAQGPREALRPVRRGRMRVIPVMHEVPPEIRVGHVETPSPLNRVRHQGQRRGRPHGRAPIACAIEDALKPLGVKITPCRSPPPACALIREAETHHQPAAAE